MSNEQDHAPGSERSDEDQKIEEETLNYQNLFPGQLPVVTGQEFFTNEPPITAPIDQAKHNPLHDIPAEQNVLAGMIIGPDTHQIRQIITESDFYQVKHSIIFSHICTLTDNDNPVDIITLAHSLRADGKLTAIGGPLYLHKLISEHPIPGNPIHYAKMVATTAITRKIIETATRIKQQSETEIYIDKPHLIIDQAINDLETIQKEDAKKSQLTRFEDRIYVRSRLDQIPKPTHLIDGILDTETITVIAGKFASYKTFISLAWAASIATATPWLGRKINTPGPIFYIAGEGCNGLTSRLKAWEHHNLNGQQVPSENFYVYNGALNLYDTSPDNTDRYNLKKTIKKIKPVLVIIDTLSKCAPGADENSSADISTIYNYLNKLREKHGCTFLINHHTGHTGTRSRGTSGIEDNADTVWIAQRDEETGPTSQRTLIHRKAKAQATQPDIPLILIPGGGDMYVDEGFTCSQTVPSRSTNDGFGNSLENEPDFYLPESLSVLKIIQQLEHLGIPTNAGRPTCEKALRKAGNGARSSLVAEAIRRRKLGTY